MGPTDVSRTCAEVPTDPPFLPKGSLGDKTDFIMNLAPTERTPGDGHSSVLQRLCQGPLMCGPVHDCWHRGPLDFVAQIISFAASGE